MLTLLTLIAASEIILALLVFLAIVKIAKLESLFRKPEGHKSPKLSKNFEKKVEAEVEKLIAAAGRRIDAKLSEYFQTLVDDATKKGTELAAFAEKQQGVIVKETQFLVARDIAKLQEDLQKYRADQMARIDQEVHQMVSDIAKQVLGKAIDVSTHEDLVKAALERAKKESLLENAKH